MKSLRDYEWETRYSSATHNLIKDFFIPALSQSRFYYRIAGYFSSTAIAAAFRGISAFVENGEKMMLIIGSELSEEDIDAINNGIKRMGDILNKKWEECVKEFEKDVIRKRFELLAWLVANNKIDIKIGVNKDSNGRLIPSTQSLFHEKMLIFEDYNGNMIQLDGSINETWKAWRKNRESFCVHKSWVEGNEVFVKTAKEEFDKVWNNLDKSCTVMDLPEAIEKKIISIKPKIRPNIDDEIDFEIEIEESPKEKERELRKYQKEAIEAWVNSGYKGILEMATGTGKTFTALKAIKQLDLKSKILIIGVPQTELATQWADECDDVLFDVKKRIVLCYYGTDWKSNISREIRQSKRESCLCIIIVVLDTMRSKLFLEKVRPLFEQTYLIIDEVHEIGSTENKKILDKTTSINFRLGLSATPERAWDEDGNSAIREYFGGGPVFIWDLPKAINPPKGYERCLSSYKYYLHDSNFTGEELTEYEDLSGKIRRKLGILTKGGKVPMKNIENEPSLKILRNQRAAIVKRCKDKYRVLQKILGEHHSSLKKCLIYCNDEKHMDEVAKIVMRNGFNCRKFYGVIDKEEREKIFKSFEEDDVQFLVAIKCLDQGIDLPICNSAIILASSQNPREYVQRRGRILRLHKDKEYAIVHDVIVLPYPIENLSSGEKKLEDFEARLLDSQLKRIKIFTENSMNRGENYLKILGYGDLIVKALRS